jgi:ribosomal-protein-alanine N-acetyltransferase
MMKIRPMTVADIDEVAGVEKDCFARPWNEDALYRDYAQNPSSHFFVADVEGRVVGHLGLWRRHDHVHVTTLAVDPSHRRNGIGQALLKAVRDKYPTMDLTLEVRKSNEDAQDFYRSSGFKVTGSRPDYYTNNGEDALVMSLHAESKEPVVDGRS